MECNRTMNIMSKIYGLILLLSLSAFGQFHFDHEIAPSFGERMVRFSSLTVSQFGDFYLIESKGHEIYRLNPTGQILNISGGFGWEEERFDTPLDITMASGLDLLVADYNNHRIVRFDRELNYLTSYPDPNSDIELSFPRSVAMTNLGEIFILSDENAEIIRLSVSQNSVLKFGGIEYGAYALTNPLLIRINQSGIIHVIEENGRILQFDRFGTPIKRLRVPIEAEIRDMAVAGDDIILLVFNKEPIVMQYSAKKQTWLRLQIEDLPESNSWVSIKYRNDNLFLLTSGGRIFVCNRMNNK